MVRCSLACPHTVASIILIKVIRSLGLSSNCGRVLEDSVSTAIETATISFDKKPLRDMENPLSKPRKSMVRIGAITGIVIKLGLYQLCFLAMIVLVGISTFSKSPLIGGETCVQIPYGITPKFFLLLLCGSALHPWLDHMADESDSIASYYDI